MPEIKPIDEIEVPIPEYVINQNPYEKLIYDLLDNMKHDWNAYGIKLWLVQRLDKIHEEERQQDDI